MQAYIIRCIFRGLYRPTGLVVNNPLPLLDFRSRGNSGSIVSDYVLDDPGSIPDRGRGFFF
jgi:hypothetical protein